MSLVNLIKQASMGAYEAGNPVAILFGTVTKINPLEINIEQKKTLPEDFFIIPERLMPYEVDIQHTHPYSGGNTGGMQPDATRRVVIRKGLEVGDKVILLRVQGGRQYVILDRVG